MTFELYTDVALARDLPEHGLCRGDILRLVDRHVGPGGEEGYSAEVLGATGQTQAVIAVAAKLLEPLRADEILSGRPLKD